MDEDAREMLLDYIFEIGDAEELSGIGRIIRRSAIIREACKRELKKVSIERYLDGVMSTAEEEHFLKMLAEDQSLVYELSLRKKINEAIESNLLKDILIEVCKEDIPFTPEEKQGSVLYEELRKGKKRILSITPKYTKWIAAASIAILMLFGAGISYQVQTRDSLENRLYSKYYEPFDETIGYVAKSSGFNLALQKYKKGEYQNAYLLFQELPSLLQIDAEKYFYTGLILMEMEHYSEAINVFNKCINASEGVGYFSLVEWYKGLCYLKTKEIEKAKEVFRTIASNNVGNYKEASKILKKLE